MLGTVDQVLDAGRTRLIVYVAVAALAAIWYVRERRAAVHTTHGVHDRGALWPNYWLLTTLVLLTMGTGRAGALSDAVSELGRERARSSGWYEQRRDIQAIAAGVVTVGWLLGVLVAVWRVPLRRRRYLANVTAISALAAFAAIRLISLHHIDTVLYRRDLAGVRFVSITELVLLSIAAITILAVRRFPGTENNTERPSAADRYSSSNTTPAAPHAVGRQPEVT